MADLAIGDVRTILTAPSCSRLVVVKVETTEPGLYGLGCATFTQRHLAVRTAVEGFLRPFLIGKDPQRIEDIWQTAHVNSYWRNGPVLNNALAGVDMALWDIKGKLAGMPVYQLLGGKCREAAAVYRHADGKDEAEVEEKVRAYLEQGYHYIRCQMGGYGGKFSVRHKPEKARQLGTGGVAGAAGAVGHLVRDAAGTDVTLETVAALSPVESGAAITGDIGRRDTGV